MIGRVGPETRAILDELRALRKGLVEGPELGGLFHGQNTISKAAAFTGTAGSAYEINCQGYNLVQIATDGDQTDITYRIRYLNGNVGPTMLAAASPHIVGKIVSVIVTNAEAEAGKTIYLDKYLAPWSMLAAIKHGTSLSAKIEASGKAFKAEKVEYVAGADNFFETDQALASGAPTLSMLTVPLASKIRVNRIMWEFYHANAVTHQLYLLSGAAADAAGPTYSQRRSDVFFDSGAGMLRNTTYSVIENDASARLPVVVTLDTEGTIYYMMDVSGATGNSAGFIKVWGDVLG